MLNTDNYGLAVGMTTDDFVAPEHVDRPARTLDRVLGAIAGLTNGAVNYVFVTATEDTASQGSVSFLAQLQPAPPAGGLALGTITLDAEGAVTAVDNTGDRGCLALLSATVSACGRCR
jgi:hypothetical protein